MKYYSEVLKKFYDDVNTLKQEEEAFNAEAVSISNERDKLRAEIDKANQAVEDAYKNYEVVKKEAWKIMLEANEKVDALLDDAKKQVESAIKQRTDARNKFAERFKSDNTDIENFDFPYIPFLIF